ncbi:hypothetical protein P9112_009758 [Eukaryota sp. TZLM1-RC]
MAPLTIKVLFKSIQGLNELVFRHWLTRVVLPVLYFSVTTISLYVDSKPVRRTISFLLGILHLLGALFFWFIPHPHRVNALWVAIIAGPTVVSILFFLEAFRLSPRMVYRVHRSPRRKLVGVICSYTGILWFGLLSLVITRKMSHLGVFGWPSPAALLSLGVLITASKRGLLGNVILLVLSLFSIVFSVYSVFVLKYYGDTLLLLAATVGFTIFLDDVRGLRPLDGSSLKQE